MKENLLLIFVRNPELGKVKSRLAKSVGPKSALDIYNFLLNHTKKVTEHVNADKQIWYSNFIDHDDLWDESVYKKHIQKNHDDLGVRMQYAFEQGFQQGYKNIIIIGSDMYDIATAEINTSFEKLKNRDAIIGPAEDGGYYLLGLTQMITPLFKNKNWGTETVFKDSLIDLKNYILEQLETKNDVDYVEDIEHIPAFQSFLKTKQHD